MEISGLFKHPLSSTRIFLLAFIARRRLTEDLSPTFLLFKLLKIADPFLLSCGHQPVTAHFPDTRHQFTRRRFPSALIYDLTANDTSHFRTLDPTANSSATRLAIANDLRLISGSR